VTVLALWVFVAQPIPVPPVAITTARAFVAGTQLELDRAMAQARSWQTRYGLKEREFSALIDGAASGSSWLRLSDPTARQSFQAGIHAVLH
jgi:hypothetical protein